VSVQLVGNILLWIAAVPAVGSVIVFSRVTWWRSTWGRHLMAYMAAVSIPLVLGCVRQIFGDSSWFQGLRVAAFGLVVVVLWWRFIITIQALREGSPDEGDLEKRPQQPAPHARNPKE